MKTITQISKRTLAHFKDKKYVFTPDEYQKVFCEEAKKLKVIVNDCNKIANFTQRLNKSYQKLLSNYRVKSVDDLLMFLIGILNREHIEETKEFTNELFVYTKRVLQVIDMFPSKAKYIASKHLDFLRLSSKVDEIKILRNEWLEFMTNYDDRNFQFYKKRCHLTDDDVLEMLPKLEKCFSKNDELSELGDAIIFSLIPSFAPFMDDEVATLNELKNNPSFLTSVNIAEEIKNLTKKRILKDKLEIKKKFIDIDKISEVLSKKVLSFIKNSSESREKIKLLSKELKQINTNDEIKIVKERLSAILNSLDEEMNKFQIEIEKENNEIELLREKVKLLENELKELKKETKKDGQIDNETNNKFQKIEKLYKSEQKNYSVVFFEVDNFETINKNYGYEAGDVILKSIEVVLTKEARKEDIIDKVEGKKFVVIMPETSKKGAYKFIKKVSEIIEKTKFIYKKTIIRVTISAGVAEREEAHNTNEIIKLANERLYKAKREGKNRIAIK